MSSAKDDPEESPVSFGEGDFVDEEVVDMPEEPPSQQGSRICRLGSSGSSHRSTSPVRRTRRGLRQSKSNDERFSGSSHHNNCPADADAGSNRAVGMSASKHRLMRRGLRRNKSGGEAEPLAAGDKYRKGKLSKNGSTHSRSIEKADLPNGQQQEHQGSLSPGAVSVHGGGSVTPGVVSAQGRGLRKNTAPDDKFSSFSTHRSQLNSTGPNSNDHLLLDTSDSANGSLAPGVASVQGRGMRKNSGPDDKFSSFSTNRSQLNSTGHNNNDHSMLDRSDSANGQQISAAPGVVSAQGRGLRKNTAPNDGFSNSSHHKFKDAAAAGLLSSGSLHQNFGADLTPAQITGASARRGLNRKKSGDEQDGGPPSMTKIPSGAGLRAMRNHARESIAPDATAERQESQLRDLVHQGNITVLPGNAANNSNLSVDDLIAASIQAEAHLYEEKRRNPTNGQSANMLRNGSNSNSTMEDIPNGVLPDSSHSNNYHPNSENRNPERELSSEPPGTLRYTEGGVARRDAPLPKGASPPEAYSKGPGDEYDRLSWLDLMTTTILGRADDPVGEGPSAEDIKASKKRCCMIGGVCLVVVVIIIVVVAVVVGGSGGSEADPVVPNNESEGEQLEDNLAGFNLGLVPDLPMATLAKLDDPESPQSQAFIWLSEDPNWQDYPDWRKRQRFALACFYYAMGGTNWPASNEQAINWLNYDIDECQWMAYEPNACHEDGGVKLLNFTRLSRFRGFVPPEIELLTQLLQLDFSNNIFTNIPFEDLLPLKEEALPQDIASIQCARCRLEGSLPSEIGKLTGLQSLVLSGNSLTGSIPTELGLLTRLTVVMMEQNEFNGTIPTEVVLLTSLNRLALTDNSISGPIPREIGNLSQLVWLGINFNALNETLPTSMGRLSQLVRIDLESNTLSGPLITELGLLSQLTTLDLLGNGLTGTVPSEVGRLTSLLWFGLATNALSGTIPTESGKMTSVTHFDLPFNRLVGKIPSELGLLTQMTHLYLIENSITGTVPPEVEALPNLATLDF